MKKCFLIFLLLPVAGFAQYYEANMKALIVGIHAGYQVGPVLGGYGQGNQTHQVIVEASLYMRSLKFKAFWFTSLAAGIPLNSSPYNHYALSVALGVGGYLGDWRTSGGYGSTLIMHGAVRLPFVLTPGSSGAFGADFGPEIAFRYQYHRGANAGFSLGFDLGFNYYAVNTTPPFGSSGYRGTTYENQYGMRFRFLIGVMF